MKIYYDDYFAKYIKKYIPSNKYYIISPGFLLYARTYNTDTTYNIKKIIKNYVNLPEEKIFELLLRAWVPPEKASEYYMRLYNKTIKANKNDYKYKFKLEYENNYWVVNTVD